MLAQVRLAPKISASTAPVVLFVAISASMVGFRIVEALNGNPAGWLRIALSSAAIAFFCFAKRSLVRRAFVALALETAGGLLTLVYVDVPFVHDHVAAIASASASAYERVEHRSLALDVVAIERILSHDAP